MFLSFIFDSIHFFSFWIYTQSNTITLFTFFHKRKKCFYELHIAYKTSIYLLLFSLQWNTNGFFLNRILGIIAVVYVEVLRWWIGNISLQCQNIFIFMKSNQTNICSRSQLTLNLLYSPRSNSGCYRDLKLHSANIRMYSILGALVLTWLCVLQVEGGDLCDDDLWRAGAYQRGPDQTRPATRQPLQTGDRPES